MVAILLSSPAKSIEIQAQALLKDMVVIVVDGTRRVIKAGDRSPEGVLLVTSSPHHAVVEVNGQRQQLTLSTQISSAFATKNRREVSIPRNQFNQYVTTGTINGRRAKVLVDTGATVSP